MSLPADQRTAITAELEGQDAERLPCPMPGFEKMTVPETCKLLAYMALHGHLRWLKAMLDDAEAANDSHEAAELIMEAVRKEDWLQEADWLAFRRWVRAGCHPADSANSPALFPRRHAALAERGYLLTASSTDEAFDKAFEVFKGGVDAK
jgi:hypothetical protein